MSEYGFFDFMSRAQVLELTVAYIVGIYADDLTNALMDIVLVPIINGITNNDVDKLENYKVNIGKVPIKVGQIIYLLIKLILFLIIIYILIFAIPKLAKKTSILTGGGIISSVPTIITFVIGNYFGIHMKKLKL